MVGFHALYERHSRDVYRFALFLSGGYSLLPFAFLMRQGRIEWIMMRDRPTMAAAFALAALACWLAAYIINRRARYASASIGE
jgi:hypothetical protein